MADLFGDVIRFLVGGVVGGGMVSWYRARSQNRLDQATAGQIEAQTDLTAISTTVADALKNTESAIAVAATWEATADKLQAQIEVLERQLRAERSARSKLTSRVAGLELLLRQNGIEPPPVPNEPSAGD